MGTTDVLRTDAAVRGRGGPAGTSDVGGVLGSEEAGEDPSEWEVGSVESSE